MDSENSGQAYQLAHLHFFDFDGIVMRLLYPICIIVIWWSKQLNNNPDSNYDLSCFILFYFVVYFV